MSNGNPIENPFPGLRPFTSDESHLFFGRDGRSDELLERLGKNRFLAVVGTSGSGKSSLVRAGLLPTVHGGFIAGAGSHWRVAVLRPGDNPIKNLAEALGRPGVLKGKPSTEEEHDIPARTIDTEIVLRRGCMGLIELFRQSRLPEEENLLIVVDQFEELFRFKESTWMENAPDEAAAFVKLLLTTVEQKEIPIYIVLTMRSEFLGDCAQFRDLPEAVNNSQYLIPRMTRDEKREAIEGPVAVGGAEISPALVSRLLNDVGDNPDQLPILQHALMRTWDYWAGNHTEGGPLGITHYEAIGTMERALSRHAEEAYAELKTKESLAICEKLFKLLTQKGDKIHGVRRPSKLSEICLVTNASQKDVIHVIDVFRLPGRTFLMPPIEEELKADYVIDISHESLMRIWTRLIRWVKEESNSSELYLRLAQAADLHQQEKTALWRYPELMLALKWREENKPNAAWAKRYDPEFHRAIRFLEAGKKQHDREIEEKEKRKRREIEDREKIRELEIKREEERIRRTRTRIFATIISVITIITVVLALWALDNRKEAISERQEAERQRNIADVERNKAVKQKGLAELAQKRAEEQEKIARALKEKEAGLRQIAEVNEEKARTQKDIAEKQRIIADTNAKIAAENELKAHIEELIAGMNKEDAAFGKKLAKAKGAAARSIAETRDIELKVRSAVSAYRLNSTAYSELRQSSKSIFHKFENNRLARFPGKKKLHNAYEELKNIYHRLQEKSGKESVPAEIFEALRKAYITEKKPDAVFYPAESRALAVVDNNIVFNNWEGKLLLSPLKPGPNHLIPVPNQKEIVELSGNTVLWAGAFAETNNRLFCATRDGRIIFWEKNNWKEYKLPVKYKSPIHPPILAMVYSKNKHSLVYSTKGAVYTCNLINNEVQEPDDDPGLIRALTLVENPENTFLVYTDGKAAGDKKANIYCLDLSGDGKGKKRVTGVLNSGGVHAVAYHDTKKLLALGTEDGKIFIKKIECKELQSGADIGFSPMSRYHKGIVKVLAFSPDGRYLASGGLDNIIMLWDLEEKEKTEIPRREPVLTINSELKILAVVFDARGDRLIFSDEQYLQVCPTRPEILYNELCRKR